MVEFIPLSPVYAGRGSVLVKFSGCRMPCIFPCLIRCIVRAAIKAAPTPLPSSAARISIGSSSLGSSFSGQSRISRSATAPRALKLGYLLKTDPSAPTWHSLYPFFLLMAATPQAESRAARVPMSSAVRRINSSSGPVGVRPSLLWKSSNVSERFSNGSLQVFVSEQAQQS